MLKIFTSPSRYVQGVDATTALGAEMNGVGLGGPVLVIAGNAARSQLSGLWQQSLGEAGLEYSVMAFGGECSLAEIERGSSEARSCGARTILGAGGGKVLDTARAVATEVGADVVLCPTIASTDSPTSAVSVVYSDEGEVIAIRNHPRNPALVLVDTTVILKAPKRFLVAGMGDAMSTFYEARACARSGAPNCLGGAMTQAALAISELCRPNLMANGVAALEAVEAGISSAAFETIVETNTLFSGLGFESAGLAAAHAVHNGLTVAEGTHGFLHGEKVAIGTLTQLLLEQADQEEIDELIAFFSSVGLPVTLAEIGLGDIDDETLERIAQRAVVPDESIHHEPFPVTAESVKQALLDADAAGIAWQRRASTRS